MIIKPKIVEDYILTSLQVGSKGTTELLEELQAVRAGTTKQAFYQTLRKLKKEEVVVVYAKRVSLSHIWINTMAEYFNNVKRKYSFESEKPGEDFLMLSDGEKISYTFKDPHTTDIFWGHAFGILVEQTQKDTPVLIYNPHEWFIIAREESEKTLFTNIKNRGQKLLVLIGNKNKIDIETGKWFDGNALQYFATEDKLFDKNNYYVNIFDDFIIEAWIDQTTADEIDTYYKNNEFINEQSLKSLREIVSKKGKNKLTISRNKRKAEKLRSIFKKYFLVK